MVSGWSWPSIRLHGWNLINLLFWLGGASTAAYFFYTEYFNDEGKCIKAVAESTVDSVLLHDNYVERKQTEAELKVVVGQPSSKYTAVIGPRGSGKSSVVRRVLEGVAGCVRVQLHTANQADNVFSLILKAAGAPQAFCNDFTGVDQMKPVLAACAERMAKEKHQQQRVPTIVIEVGRGIDNRTITSIARDAKDLTELGNVSVILVLSEASAAFALPQDPARQNFVWVEDFTRDEADILLDKHKVLVGDVVSRQQLYEELGTRPADLIAAIEGKEREACLAYARKRIAAAKQELQLISNLQFPGLDPPMSGKDLKALIDKLLVAPRHSVPSEDLLPGPAANPKAVTLAMKTQTSSHIILYHQPTMSYRFFSQHHLVAARELAQKQSP